MSGFIAINSHTTETVRVSNNGFFPDIDLALFHQVMRVDQTIASQQIIQALQNAIIAINAELHAWQVDSRAQSLSTIPSERYGNQTKLEHLYQTAIFNRTKSWLIESYRDYDSTESGHHRADEMQTQIDDYMRRSREAIRKMLGISRSTVELV